MKQKFTTYDYSYATGNKDEILDGLYFWTESGYYVEYWYDKEYNMYEGVIQTDRGDIGIQGNTLEDLLSDVQMTLYYLEVNEIGPV